MAANGGWDILVDSDCRRSFGGSVWATAIVSIVIAGPAYRSAAALNQVQAISQNGNWTA